MEYTFVEREVSDLHKDAYGFRPSYDFWREWELSDNDGKQAIWDGMIDSLESDEADPGDMDGDHASALASAGWGTDEDYGYDSIDSW
jgi:hypothetical protein